MATTRTTGTAEHDGESIAYERFSVAESAPGTREVVVLGHGLGGNHGSWYQQVLPLTEAGFDVVTWDQRGFGGSSRRTGSVGPVVAIEDLRALLDHLELGRCHLVGQSMGGWTAMGFALEHPDRLASLTLTDTLAGVMTDGVRAALRSGDAPARAEVGDGAVAQHPALGERFCREHPDRALLYQQLAGFGDKPDDADIINILMTTWFDVDAIAALALPVLAIVGSEDQLCPRAAMAAVVEAIPGARLAVVDGAGHSPYFEAPDDWNAALLDFLGAVTRHR
jgi:3-oxoadipate enol-lactonase